MTQYQLLSTNTNRKEEKRKKWQRNEGEIRISWKIEGSLKCGGFQLCLGNNQCCFRRKRQEPLVFPQPLFRDDYCLTLTGDPGLMTLINFNYFSWFLKYFYIFLIETLILVLVFVFFFFHQPPFVKVDVCHACLATLTEQMSTSRPLTTMSWFGLASYLDFIMTMVWTLFIVVMLSTKITMIS